MSLLKFNNPIILASTSSARKYLLDSAGIKYQAQSPDFDEDIFKYENPELSIKDLCIELAKNKALSIKDVNPDAIVIGSDQICEIDNTRIDKSSNKQEAFNQLKKMSGKTHSQNNAVVIVKNGAVIHSHYTKVDITMHSLTDKQIKSYIEQDDPVGCAGSYKLESNGKFLFKKIEGDYLSIIGMNLQEVISFLFANKYIEFNEL